MRRVLNWALVVLLVLCVSSAVIAFGGVSPQFNAPFYVTGILLAVCWAARLLMTDKVSWLRSPMHVPVAVFAGYAALWYLRAPVEYEARLELFYIGLYTLVYFAVVNSGYRREHRAVLLATVLVLAVGQSLYGLWQTATRADEVLLLQRPVEYRGRGSGTYVCPNHLAGFLAMALGLVMTSLLLRRDPDDELQAVLLRKLYEIVAAVFIALGLLATFSRGGWISTALAMVVLLVWVEHIRALSTRVVLTVFVGLVLLGAVVWNRPSFRQRFEEGVRVQWDLAPGDRPIQVVSGLTGRVPIWRATLNMVRDRPILGTGPGSWAWVHLRYRDPGFQHRPDYAHNDVLQLTSNYGVIGLILVTGIFGCFFWHAIRVSRPIHTTQQRAFAVGSGVAISAILVHSFADFNMYIPANALLVVILMALTAAMDDGEQHERRVLMKRAVKIPVAIIVLLIAAWCAWVGGCLTLSQRYAAQADDAREVLDWDRALVLYRRALALDPRYPVPYARIGDIYRTQAMLRPSTRESLAHQAIEAYRQSLALNPLQSDVLLRLAAAAELVESKDTVLEVYRRTLDIDPNNGFAYMRLGIFLRHIGDDERAAEAFEKSWLLSQQDRTALLHLQEIRSRK